MSDQRPAVPDPYAAPPSYPYARPGDGTPAGTTPAEPIGSPPVPSYDQPPPYPGPSYGPARFQQAPYGQAPYAPSSGQGAYGLPPGQPYAGAPGGPQDAFSTAPVPYAGTPQQYAAYTAGGYTPPAVQGELASWGARVGASMIDGLIQSGPMLLLYVPLVAVSVQDPYGESDTAAALGLAMLGAYVWMFAWWIGNRIVRQGRTGQSIGKKVMRLQLVSLHTARPLGPGATFGRELAHLLDSYSLYIGYLWPLWDDKRQTFADKVCSTVVVRVP